MAESRTYRLIALLLFALLKMNAQNGDTLTQPAAEKISYDLYVAKSWENLSVFCDRAIGDGFDYYYMRMRAGISWYERGRYRKAIGHFKAALAFNSGDESANEYLYYSYIYAGEYEEARRLTKSFDSSFAARLGTKEFPAISAIMPEGGVKVTSNSLFQPASYASVGLSHYVERRLSMFHAATFYGQNESRFNTKQYQYYLRATVPFNNGFKLMAGFHYCYNVVTYTSSAISKITQVQLPPPPGYPPPPPGQGKYINDTTFTTSSTQQFINTFIGALTLMKQSSYFDVFAGATMASIDTVVHSQVNAGLMVYPLGNNKLSFGATAYYHSNDYFRRSYLALVPSLNIAPTGKTMISLSYLTNSGYNTFEQTGYLLNNSPDLSTSRLSASFSYQVSKKIQLYALYCYEAKRDNYRNFNYYYNAVIAGIKIFPQTHQHSRP